LVRLLELEEGALGVAGLERMAALLVGFEGVTLERRAERWWSRRRGHRRRREDEERQGDAEARHTRAPHLISTSSGFFGRVEALGVGGTEGGATVGTRLAEGPGVGASSADRGADAGGLEAGSAGA